MIMDTGSSDDGNDLIGPIPDSPHTPVPELKNKAEDKSKHQAAGSGSYTKHLDEVASFAFLQLL